MKPWFVVALLLACSSKTDAPRPRDTPTAGSAAPVTPVAPADDRFDEGSLGALSFELSEGKPEARAHFRRGLLALHSFWYDEARREFSKAMIADPTMNLAYWGVAMTYLELLWGQDDLDAAKKIMSQMPNPDLLSPREQAWVWATIELVKAGDVLTSRKRFLTSLEQLHANFPDDESATFLALALLSTTRPEDADTLAVRRRAAALAQQVYDKNPKHPGAAHYVIHAYDVPELAAQALPHAQAYAKIAPAAFHARHMPAHIFSRLGMWREAIASCQAAWDASLAAAARNKLSANHHDFHSLQWLVEMNFELGQRKAADAALARFAEAVRTGLSRQHRTTYATEVASYLARTGEWARVDELLAPLEAKPLDEGSPAQADARRGSASHCAPTAANSAAELAERMAVLDAKARAAAHRRDLAATKRLVAELDTQRAELRPFLQTTQPAAALARIDAGNARYRAALLARAAGDDRALLAIQRKALADAHTGLGGESNPSAFLAHEELADTLVRLDQPAEAAKHYALALDTHPKRAHSLLGAARAAARANDASAARDHYRQLVELWAAADDGTDGLAEAKAALSSD